MKTVVNEDETKSCKMAQVHTNDGFIWSGELEVGDVIFSKDNNAIFHTEGKHISGSFENDLTFMVKAEDKELDMEILVHGENLLLARCLGAMICTMLILETQRLS